MGSTPISRSKVKKYKTHILIITAFIIGFFIRGLVLPYFQTDLFPINDILPSRYGCNQIARWYADYLIREYKIEFNTDINNPRRDINQKASNLNGDLLEICLTDPTK